MNSKRAKHNFSPITKLYIKWGQNSFLFTLACIVWLVWRVGTKPTRINYPCSQFALWQTFLFFSTASTPLLNICHKCITYIRNREYTKLAGIALLIFILIGSFNLYENHRESQLRIAGGGTIPISSSMAMPWVHITESGAVSQHFEFPSTISTEQAVVSFRHDPSINYGGTPPYDPEVNPAYDFVWETVERLGLGSSSNPLDALINDGDTVLIKPNWVDFGPAVYTRPEVVRPLIDMAIAAGAVKIYVGDGGSSVPVTNNVMNSAGYTAMVSELDSRHPGINIETVNLNVFSSGWHWISLSNNSSFAGSGYSHYDLGTGSGTLFDHTYYNTPDPQGVNPEGETLGWYAVNDKVLDADVIINASKMKTHQEMMATMSIKNLVGLTLSSTFNASGYLHRIAHHHQPKEANYFNNDIFWRAILDMNKIVLYTDKNGDLQPTQQRRYLNVVDGIQAMEKSQHHEYGGGGIPYNRHVILAGVDPVAVDAVGCRIMGYDYSVIPSIGNADTDTVHPIGTNDIDNIVVAGDEINSEIDHVFEFNSNWDQDAGALAITDFTPPTIHSVDRDGNTVTTNISGGLAAYILYQTGETEYAEKMSQDGDTYSETVPGTVSEYWILAQDEHFNTSTAIQSWQSPSVNTDAATSVGATTATLNGTIDDDGGEACQYRFEYDTDSGEPYNYSTAWTGSKTTGQSFSETIAGLSQGVTYYFRAQAKNSAGTGSGSELTLITTTGEIISFTVTDYGHDGVQFGIIDPGQENQPADCGDSQGAVTLTVGSETNVNVDILIKGNDFSGPGTIGISNVRYDLDDDPTGSNTLDTNYAIWYTVTQPLAEDDVRHGYHWISIPEGQAPGTYSSTFYYQALKSP